MKREGVYGPYYKACRILPCILAQHPDHAKDCGRGGDAHHVKRVGAGGKDVQNVVPMCRLLHSMCHGQIYGVTEKDVEERFSVDLKQLAIDYESKIRQAMKRRVSGFDDLAF